MVLSVFFFLSFYTLFPSPPCKIMMLSVVKHTKSKVKFWFLANFLSPRFKQFIPFMAAKCAVVVVLLQCCVVSRNHTHTHRYGFECELVTYQWPSWLRHQSEKQRVIWGCAQGRCFACFL